MAQISTFVVLAIKCLVADLFTRWTIAIAAFAVTFVLSTVAHLSALEFARELDSTCHFFLLLPTSTALEYDLTTRVARSVMTSACTRVNVARELFVTRVATSRNILCALSFACRFAAWTRALQTAWTLTTCAIVTHKLALVETARVRFSADLGTLPVGLGARNLFSLFATSTWLYAHFVTCFALIRMANSLASMLFAC